MDGFTHPDPWFDLLPRRKPDGPEAEGWTGSLSG
jgi:hypothetical protein